MLALLLAAALLGGPTVASAQRSHTVRSGQSLARIARRHRVSVWDLALANDMRPNDTLRVGQILRVPSQHVTFVRPGQTLSHIARDHRCTINELVRLNRLRGRTLRVGQRIVLPGYTPRAARRRDWGEPEVAGRVTLRRRDEVAVLTLVDESRRVTRAGLEGLARLMRRHEDDPPEVPHPRLALLLAAVSDHFGGREITVVSGRREVGGWTRESSRHVSGRAADIRVRGVPRRILWDYCRSLRSTGCGYYPRSTFVHVDVRDRAAQWVDWSRPGRRPRYGNLRRPFRRRGRRRHEERVTRQVTRPDDVPLDVTLTPEAQALIPEGGFAPDVEIEEDLVEDADGDLARADDDGSRDDGGEAAAGVEEGTEADREGAGTRPGPTEDVEELVADHERSAG
ncbi:MAG: LysM peptidoglycan-binding domain-containing protein [Sandaracinaceae bacterium]